MAFPVVIHDTTGGAHFNPAAAGAGGYGHVVDALAHGRWPWGTKMVYPDGRCFRWPRTHASGDHLRAAGHTVAHASFTHGGEDDFLDPEYLAKRDGYEST